LHGQLALTFALRSPTAATYSQVNMVTF